MASSLCALYLNTHEYVASAPPHSHCCASLYRSHSIFILLTARVCSPAQDIGRWLIEQLCEFIVTNIENLYSGKRTLPRLGAVVSEALLAMSEWLMNTQVRVCACVRMSVYVCLSVSVCMLCGGLYMTLSVYRCVCSVC